MRIPQNASQRIKAACHLAQAVLIFVAGCITLTIYTRGGTTGGEVGFYFALCFLTFPAIVYLTMVPMWTRAWRFNNVYALATLDMVYALLWFAAFITILAWTATGGNGNEDEDEDNGEDKTCHGGSEYKCTLGKVSGGMGAFVFLTFVATSYYSVRDVMTYKRTGVMPNGQPKGQRPLDGAGEDPAKDAWSANTDELDPHHPSNRLPLDDDDHNLQGSRYGQVPTEEDQGLLGYNPHGAPRREDPFADSNARNNSQTAHPGRRLSYESSLYPPPTLHAPSPSPPMPDAGQNQYITPSALSPTGYDPGSRLEFPQANYGRL